VTFHSCERFPCSRFWGVYRSIAQKWTSYHSTVRLWGNVISDPLPSSEYCANHLENNSCNNFSIVACAYFRRCLEMGLSIYLSICGSTALVYLDGLFSFLTHTLLGREMRRSEGRYLHTEWHQHGINAHRLPCLGWDSTPLSQCSNERRRFMP
jgi:hypothetical protein